MLGADAATERDMWRKHAAFAAHTKKERRKAAAVRSAALTAAGLDRSIEHIPTTPRTAVSANEEANLPMQ